jgi:hypothetical protein
MLWLIFQLFFIRKLNMILPSGVVFAQIFEFVENISHLFFNKFIVLLISDSHHINKFKDLLIKATIVNIFSSFTSHAVTQCKRHQ